MTEVTKDEITDMGNVVENTINPKGEDKRNIFANLRAQRGGTTFYNVIGSRAEALKNGTINEEQFKEEVRKVIKSYGKDIGVDFEVVYLDKKLCQKIPKEVQVQLMLI